MDTIKKTTDELPARALLTDAIVIVHNPHVCALPTGEERERELDASPTGLIGETMAHRSLELALVYYLEHNGSSTMHELCDVFFPLVRPRDIAAVLSASEKIHSAVLHGTDVAYFVEPRAHQPTFGVVSPGASSQASPPATPTGPGSRSWPNEPPPVLRAAARRRHRSRSPPVSPKGPLAAPAPAGLIRAAEVHGAAIRARLREAAELHRPLLPVGAEEQRRITERLSRPLSPPLSLPGDFDLGPRCVVETPAEEIGAGVAPRRLVFDGPEGFVQK